MSEPGYGPDENARFRQDLITTLSEIRDCLFALAAFSAADQGSPIKLSEEITQEVEFVIRMGGDVFDA